MAVEITESEEQSGSGLSLLGGLVVAGAIIAAFVGHNPAMTVSTQAVPNSSYVAIAQQDARTAGINPTMFVKQINQESGFNQYAVSSAGAIGIAQFMPSTAASMGFDPHDPVASLKEAALLDAENISRFGSESKALAAYNAGAGAVDQAVNQCGGAWQSCLPAETQNYIGSIEQ